MAQNGFGNRPFLDLIKDACACLREGEKVRSDYGEADLSARKGKIGNGVLKDCEYYSRNDGTESAEGDTSLQKAFYVFVHYFKPNLSFTFFKFLRDT